jgi:hypothetical protein
MHRRTQRAPVGLAVFFASVLVSVGAASATIDWKGHSWQVTAGGMAGVCAGSASNVSIDSNGYLHLQISESGSTWTAAEVFTTDQLGFGTYQWQLDGPIDSYDKNVVVGLFPYGPAAGIGSDGTNEIDIEYSRWGYADGPNGDYTDYPASGTTIGELSYTFSLAGSTLSTSRFTWTTTSITSSLFDTLLAVSDAGNPIEHWSYAPPNPSVNVPQQALPLGMNLWCFDTPPSDGQAVELVIRDFTFIPAAAGTGGAGGASGNGGLGGASAEGGTSGTTSAGAGGTRSASAGAGGRRSTSAGAAGTRTASAGTAGVPENAGAGGTARAGAGGMPNTAAGVGGTANANAGAAGSSATAEVGGAGAVAGGNAAGGTLVGATAGAGALAGAGAVSANAPAARGCGCMVPRRHEHDAPSVAVLTLGAWRRRRRHRQ